MDTIKKNCRSSFIKHVPEGIAFNIATFLEEGREEKRSREDYEAFYKTLLTADRKGKRKQFPRYGKNFSHGQADID